MFFFHDARSVSAHNTVDQQDHFFEPFDGESVIDAIQRVDARVRVRMEVVSIFSQFVGNCKFDQVMPETRRWSLLPFSGTSVVDLLKGSAAARFPQHRISES